MCKSVSKSAQSDNKCQFPRLNNLEWLRLVFALQVVTTHTVSHLDLIHLPALFSNFPGVPAFFFVSGFLIYSSYLNAPGNQYFVNRFLRLFPGLFIVTLGSLGVVVLALGWEVFLNNVSTFLIWFLSQITLGQAYNPALFRSVGVGVINGSLWTITVEIIFYIWVPILVWLEKHFRFALFFFMAASFSIYAMGPLFLDNIVYRNKTTFDLISLTPIVWGWMFGFGIIASKYFRQIKSFIKFTPFILIPMIAMAFYGEGVLFSATGNRLGLVYFVCYVAVIIWVAFGLTYIKLPFDISYGAYIWHMPIINLLLICQIYNFYISTALTVFIAALSWFLVEKPMLKLKRKSLRPV